MASGPLASEAAAATPREAVASAAIRPAETGFEQIRATIDEIELWPAAPAEFANRDPEAHWEPFDREPFDLSQAIKGAGPATVGTVPTPAPDTALARSEFDGTSRIWIESVDLEPPSIHGIEALSGIPLLQMTTLGL